MSKRWRQRNQSQTTNNTAPCGLHSSRQSAMVLGDYTMKNIRFTELVEHRFVHETTEPPAPLNDLARALAREIGSNPIADTDLVGAVWKVPLGAEMSVPDKCAAKLIALGYAELVSDALAAATPAAPAAAA
ncbi:hypothetical protein MKK75_32335 [Methylobacterium sp. J-030]|uniref:hypothetical protein n=1 Tax=Methylobacterium sp. J-030 TaxID=2836627 RepID=UPI001FBA0F81|nr:hypothetical protein [Methylobacterium sp. J-030]MCJ2073420.1 hypothetical protein [Methylobacterium sp. J-030]